VAQLIDQKVVLDVPVIDRHGDDDGLAIDQGRGQQQFSFQIVDEGRSLADIAGDQSDEAFGANAFTVDQRMFVASVDQIFFDVCLLSRRMGGATAVVIDQAPLFIAFLGRSNRPDEPTPARWR
jgi:hypothetical protein